jgi:hypothetical protein
LTFARRRNEICRTAVFVQGGYMSKWNSIIATGICTLLAVLGTVYLALEKKAVVEAAGVQAPRA